MDALHIHVRRYMTKGRFHIQRYSMNILKATALEKPQPHNTNSFFLYLQSSLGQKYPNVNYLPNPGNSEFKQSSELTT